MPGQKNLENEEKPTDFLKNHNFGNLPVHAPESPLFMLMLPIPFCKAVGAVHTHAHIDTLHGMGQSYNCSVSFSC